MNTTSFSPGIKRYAESGNAKIVRKPYEGLGMSMDELGQKIREGMYDPDVRGWGGDVLIKAGKPKSIKARTQAVLDEFRRVTIYVPDPPRSEYMVSAAGTLCLRPGLCVRARDCDDGVIAIGSILWSLGMEAWVLKQEFGPDAQGRPQQPHVLIAVKDERGEFLAVDPSSPDYPVGKRMKAKKEEWMNPMTIAEPHGVGSAPAGEMIGVGALPRELFKRNGIWYERVNGQWWAHHNGQWYGFGVSEGTKARAVGVGGLPRVATDIRNDLERVRAIWNSMSNDVSACWGNDPRQGQVGAKISDEVAKAFYQQFNAWESYVTATLNLANVQLVLFGDDIAENVYRWETAAYDWQQKLKNVCAISLPDSPPKRPEPKPLIPPVLSNTDSSALKTVAIAGAVVVVGAGAIYALSLLAPAIRTAVQTIPVKHAPKRAHARETPKRRRAA